MNKQNSTLVLNQYFPGFEMSLKCSFSAVLCPTPLCHLGLTLKLNIKCYFKPTKVFREELELISGKKQMLSAHTYTTCAE